MLGEQSCNFIGPLTIHAVTELVYRVKKLRFLGDFTGTNSSTEENEDFGFDIELPLPSGQTEIGRFADTASEAFFSTNANTETTIDLLSDYANGSGFDFSGYDVIHDTDSNDYHLNGYIGFYMTDYPILFVYNRTAQPLPAATVGFPADLVLACGTFQISMLADWAGGYSSYSNALTISAVEWFPYATTAGLPAWDTTTGAPANGGPGA